MHGYKQDKRIGDDEMSNTKSEPIADGKLRAVNAEMANALQELLCGVLHGFQRHNESDCIEMARAALAKAGL